MQPRANEMVQQGHGQGHALLRVGAGAQLVDENEGPCAGAADDAARFFTCAENVDRDCSIDCSSPMSAKYRVEKRERRALGCRDLHAELVHDARMPTVFKLTVLPPVFDR